MVSSVTNYNRISGLASGIDTDTMVQQMVKAQSSHLNKLQQAKTLNSWKTDSYREINTKLDDFRKSVEGLRLQSTFIKQTITSSQPDKVAVSISGKPTAASYTISSATLATPPQGASVNISVPGRTTKADADFAFNLTGTGTELINIAKDDTADQIIAKINEKSGTTGVKASFFDGSSSIILTSVATGDTADIKIDSVTDNNLGIVDGSIKSAPNFGAYSVGKNAVPGSVTINGLTLSISNNSFVYDGMKFDLKSKIDATDPVVSIQTANDTQAAFDSIKTFVDKYNLLIDDLNKKISEKKYRDYPPLLDDQKKDMQESDIKLWEEKAKSGLLNNDSTISGFLMQLRNSLTTATGGILNGPKAISDIGITSSNSYQDHGKLELDETKLKSVLDSNLEGVKTLFLKKSTLGNSSDTTVTSKAKHDDSGIGWRIYDRINSTIANFALIAGSSTSSYVDTSSLMAKQLKTINDNLYKEQDRIARYENNLYKKFTAMETALSKLNSQSSWLSQQLGQG